MSDKTIDEYLPEESLKTLMAISYISNPKMTINTFCSNIYPGLVKASNNSFNLNELKTYVLRSIKSVKDK